MREKEGLFDLPESWSWTIASEVCASVRDGTHDTPKYVEKGIPLITSKNLREGEIDFSTAKFITLEDHQQISIRSRVEDGDVLFAMIGTVGNPVLVRIDKEFSIKNVGLFKKNDSILDSKYLKFWLSSFTLEKLIEKQGLLKGTTQKFIPLGNLRNLPTPLPPLNEQRRIVAKIEALKARSQRVKEELEAARTLEDTLVAYYTTRWHEEELGKHIEERKELAGEYWYKYPVVGLSNEGKITERREPIGQKTAHKCKVIRQGDIVFNPIRFSIGSIARYRGTEPVIVSSEYQVFRTKSTMSAELICRYLRTKQGQSRLEIETQGSVRYRVYFHNLQRLVMPTASPEQQAEAEQFFVCLNKTLC
jgi:restriction endonuclease S subunit